MNKKFSLSFLSACALLSTNQLRSDYSYCCDKSYAFGQTHLSQRPQGNYYHTVMMGTADKTHVFGNDENYINFNLTLGLRSNFDECELGQYFFTRKGPIVVGPNGNNVDIINLNLGLANNYQGNALLCPQINTALAELDFYAGFDKWLEGSWIRVRAPFVKTRWQPCLRTATSEAGAPFYPEGFAYPTGNIGVVYHDLADALQENKSFSLIPGLEAGRFACNQSLYGLSDLHFEIGYDYFRRERGNIGIALIGAWGTGQPNATKCNQFIFPPSYGSQCSSQFGVAFRGQYQIFNNSTDNKRITIYSDLRVVHLLEGYTKRLLGLSSNEKTAFNQYLILDRYTATGTYLGAERAANLLNKKVKVSTAAMLEFTIMSQILKDDWDFSLGYNLWYRSKECVQACDNRLGNGHDLYTIKGNSTINDDYTYSKIDSDVSILGTPVADTNLDNIKTAAFREGDIVTCVAENPETYSSLLFAYIGHNFSETWLNPYLGLGGNIEFGRGNTALSTWGLYVKGGISY